MQTDAAVTHHRVLLMQGFAALLDFLDGDAEFAGEFLLLVLGVRDELVERRVEQTEHDRLAVHDGQGALDGGLDVRLEVGQGGAALLVGVAEDHLAELGERTLGVLAVEHVLDTEQADAFRAELHGLCGIFRGIGVGADTELAELVDDAHELGEQRVLGGVHRVDADVVDQTLGAVEAQPVTFLVLPWCCCRRSHTALPC